jgi:hypothetical protein
LTPLRREVLSSKIVIFCRKESAMKNFTYAVLAALLLSSMMAGCNTWPFKKKQPIEPPIVNLPPVNVTPDPIRPDPIDTVGLGDPIPVDTTPPVGGDSTYTIKKKDTLWSIAVKHLGNGQRYREILAANPGLDAKKLAVGKTIALPPR